MSPILQRKRMQSGLAGCGLVTLIQVLYPTDLTDGGNRLDERRRQLGDAIKEASSSGGDVQSSFSQSSYSMPDDHSPNIRGRKSRTAPGGQDSGKDSRQGS